MTRRQAGVVRKKQPTRATKRGSLNRYCRPMKQIGVGLYEDFYGQKYEQSEKGTLSKP